MSGKRKVKRGGGSAGVEVRVESPQLRTPVCLIIDDGVPLYCGDLIQWGKRVVPDLSEHRLCLGQGSGKKRYEESVGFLNRFLAVVQAHNIKGKFSLVPHVPGVGFIHRSFSGRKGGYLRAFLTALREGTSSRFDYTPEVITHDRVYDIKKRKLRGEWEWVWSQKQPAGILAEYLVYAFRLLQDSGFLCTGVTSPCDFGAKNEENYVDAIRVAMREVFGTRRSWYFLHSYKEGYPRIMYFDRGRKELVSSVGYLPPSDIGVRKKYGDNVARNVRHYTNKQGRGVLDKAIAQASPAVLCMHWWLMYSNGQFVGLRVLDEVCRQLAQKYRRRILWMTCSELAFYYAACKIASIEKVVKKNKITVDIESPTSCPNFTFSIRGAAGIKAVCSTSEAARVAVKAVPSASGLRPNTWVRQRNTVTICVPVDAMSRIELLQ